MKTKSGISLIAVLMFMLAATTASIVVFKWIGSENFSSAARLKNNEAYQASQAGLENVRGWLTNKGADAGALIRAFEVKNSGKPMLLNFLGDMQSSKQQKFKVYLTGVNTENQPYKFKFLSVGEARDGSKYSQAAIFDVEGLYKVKASGPPITPPGNAKKIPPYFGGIGEGTQGVTASAHVIGDLNAESGSGFGTYGELIVTGSYKMVSGGQIGCPSGYNASNGTRPSNYDALVKDSFFGDAYIKENFTAQQAGFCGNLYVGGNMEVNGPIIIWGDLYVKGNLTLGRNKLIVYGNVTIVGNIYFPDKNANIDWNFKKNLLLAGQNSTYETPAKKIEVVGTTCKVGSATPPVSGTIVYKPTEQECKSIVGGANLLDYLGNQITTSKEDSNGNPCTTGSDCIYRIRDPITLGAAVEDWKVSSVPSSGCATLKGYASSNGIIDLPPPVAGGGVVAPDVFINAVNDCYNNSQGNWKDAQGAKWLVLRVKYSDAFNLSGQTLGTPNKGNFIIIVENKPTAKIEPPLTTKETNVLMYLKQGATTIEIADPGAGKYKNYFIYSEDDIDKIDGSQYITGNLFMKNGKKVKELKDIKIQENDPLFDALSKAGVIVDNPDKCKGTGLDCTSDVPPTQLPAPQPPTGAFDPALSYVPAVPHLKVKTQSIYASEENPTPSDTAMPAILVMPRVIYLKPNQLPVKKDYFKVLYLNGANAVNDNTITSSIKNCSINSATAAGTIQICNLDLTNVSTNCKEAQLCNNAFYVVVVNN